MFETISYRRINIIYYIFVRIYCYFNSKNHEHNIKYHKRLKSKYNKRLSFYQEKVVGKSFVLNVV